MRAQEGEASDQTRGRSLQSSRGAFEEEVKGVPCHGGRPTPRRHFHWCSPFSPGQFVDVTGISRGKGFQGVMKLHNFKGGPASHGNSKAHRTPGSTGQRDAPGKVFKGKKMPGRMGGKQVTVKNTWVYKVDPARNLLWVKGQVPGATGNFVFIKDSVFKKPDIASLPFPTYIAPEDEDLSTLEPLVADLGDADPFMAAD